MGNRTILEHTDYLSCNLVAENFGQLDTLKLGKPSDIASSPITSPLIFTAEIDSFPYRLTVTCSENYLKQIKLEPYASVIDHPKQPHGQIPAGNTLLALAQKELLAYLAGNLQKFSVPCKLTGISKFQTRVLRIINSIPYGKTISYGEIARLINQPAAARAIGNACAKNPLPLLIPCHRVVRTDGSLGGYLGKSGYLSRIKAILLDLESSADSSPKPKNSPTASES